MSERKKEMSLTDNVRNGQVYLLILLKSPCPLPPSGSLL